MKEARLKGHILNDSFNMKCSEKENPETESRLALAGAEGEGEERLQMDMGFFGRVMKIFWNRQWQ